MNVLTVENTPYNLDIIPDDNDTAQEIDDIRYCVLDASPDTELDFYFLPLIFLESFNAPAICLQIGEYNIQMPMDWSILICDDEFSASEIIPLASLNNRGFQAVCVNPLTSSRLLSADISITNIYQDVKWYMPKLKHGHILAIPLEDKPDPMCAYFVKELNKVCDVDLGDLL